ncbi:hypothetical protein SAMN05216241_10159 [Limimonas halophila]|uniref:Tat pathway signal sequence domain protein n=1 Tax=Limimonas halophila TaxID=1082479 RepID=A0A1G7KZF3_9PROT|nr:hypothetical protein [Limimonas halophila]SDF42627.1 hypothetical protein SAMN05216241_10159 [Limimonas halophila]
MLRYNIIGVTGLAAGLLAGTASAETGKVGVELNKLEAVDGGCRAYMVFDNASGHAFDAYTLDLVIFDSRDVIAKRLAVRTRGLRADKTTVKLFDIQGVACGDVGRILLNRVRDCQPAGDATVDCTALTATSSRTDAAFVK